MIHKDQAGEMRRDKSGGQLKYYRKTSESDLSVVQVDLEHTQR